MFDRIAPTYDLLNRLLSAGTDVRWRRRAVDALDLSGPGRILDLCTGTADVLIEWAERGRDRSGFGIDLSMQMLERGARKLRERGLVGRTGLLSGDAERLPFRSGCFDAALVAFGIRNVGDIDAALREVARVVRSGGRFTILEFSMPSGLFGALYRLYFGHLLPLAGRLLSGDGAAYSYLPASVLKFDTPEALAARMERAGFAGVSRTRLSLGIAWLHTGTRA